MKAWGMFFSGPLEWTAAVALGSDGLFAPPVMVLLGPRKRRGGEADGEPADFDDVAEPDDEEHVPELEALDNVGTRELEEVLLFEFLEDGRFDLHELIGHEECE